MTPTAADKAYASYMLHWIEALDWPSVPVADAALPALRAWWRDSQATDLDAIAEQLWAWVDANGGPQPSTDRSMILVRMLICLAAASNRELQDVGYFEDLLDRRGVSREELRRVRAEHLLDGDDSPEVPARAASGALGEDARTAHFRRAKTRVLWAFAMFSFVSGARPMGTPEAATIEMLMIFGMALLIFMWYRFDSEERGFPRTPLLNIGMVMVAAVAMPYYLIRSRGWEIGQRSVAKALGMFLLSILLSTLGALMFGGPV
jgi:hypothetical protein